MTGRFLAVDPSSGSIDRRSGTRSEAGWAIFDGGRLESSGLIMIDGTSKKERLSSVAKTVQQEFNEPFDLLVIEDIWGYIASKTLVHACGVFIGNTNAKDIIELNVMTWKGVANRLGGWEKGDESDAIYIGVAAMVLSGGYAHKRLKKDTARQEKIDALCEENDCWGVETIKNAYEGRLNERSSEDSEESS